jgi:hypothetical protein
MPLPFAAIYGRNAVGDNLMRLCYRKISLKLQAANKGILRAFFKRWELILKA